MPDLKLPELVSDGPPPGWSQSRGFLCSCIWRPMATGWFELIAWNKTCVRHPIDPRQKQEPP